MTSVRLLGSFRTYDHTTDIGKSRQSELRWWVMGDDQALHVSQAFLSTVEFGASIHSPCSVEGVSAQCRRRAARRPIIVQDLGCWRLPVTVDETDLDICVLTRETQQHQQAHHGPSSISSSCLDQSICGRRRGNLASLLQVSTRWSVSYHLSSKCIVLRPR